MAPPAGGSSGGGGSSGARRNGASGGNGGSSAGASGSSGAGHNGASGSNGSSGSNGAGGSNGLGHNGAAAPPARPQTTYFRVKEPGFLARRALHPSLPDWSYRRRLWVDTNPSNGAVTMRCVDTDIVKIRPNGEIVLTTGGFFTVSSRSGLAGIGRTSPAV
jgi:hypothetical protein